MSKLWSIGAAALIGAGLSPAGAQTASPPDMPDTVKQISAHMGEMTMEVGSGIADVNAR